MPSDAGGSRNDGCSTPLGQVWHDRCTIPPIGVVVVKVEFDPIEAAWARSSTSTVVVDRTGKILLTSLPPLRFHAGDEATKDRMETSLQAPVAGWRLNLLTPREAARQVARNATLITASSNTSAAAGGTSPFSTYMSQSPPAIIAPVVQSGEGSTIPTGLLASANSTKVSSGTSTTGSYMRDLMRALATIGSMSSAQTSDDTDFAALVQDTTTSLNGVVSAMATDVGVLGNNQTALTNAQAHLTATSTALSGQVSAVQDVDMATTISNLTATQTQLQASYRLISDASSMTLASFLPS